MVLKVRIEADVMQVCMAHALSTEKQEVMGLLVGQVENDISHIHSLIILKRNDKRKDRVEISPEQLCKATNLAEEVDKRTRLKQAMRIIGWYHSHPHITVWPSHVDVRTQATYQLMDKDFIGLIISCFNDDKQDGGEIQVTCFQSTMENNNYERVEIEQEMVACEEMSTACLEQLNSIPQKLLDEEASDYRSTLSCKDQDLVTAVRNSAVFTQSTTQIVEMVCSPLLQHMEDQLQQTQALLDQLT